MPPARVATAVLVDPWLFSTITSFQPGLPLELVAFWKAHAPLPLHKDADDEHAQQILERVVAFGALRHLKLLQASRFRAGGRWIQPRLDRLALLAITHNRMDLLEWAIANGIRVLKPAQLWREAIVKCTNDDFTILELLKSYVPLNPSTVQRLQLERLARPTIGLLTWLRAYVPSLRIPIELTKAAAANGDLALLRYVVEDQFGANPPTSDGRRLQGECHPDAFSVALERRHVDVLDYLLETCAEYMTRATQDKIAADETPELQVLVVKHRRWFQAAFKNVLHEAFRRGEFTQVRQLVARGALVAAYQISIDRVAVHWNGIQELQFVHNHGFARATTEAMDYAAEQGRWDIVEFLHTHRSEGCTTRTMDAAARCGRLELVRFLNEKRTEGCSTEAMDAAASIGSLEIVEYLHKHSTVGSTTKAMDNAACNGHFEVVKFLHANRSEGCTTDAMDGAARRGCFRIVKFLCDHRTEGCTIAGIQAALENDAEDIVQLLYERYRQLFDTNPLYEWGFASV